MTKRMLIDSTHAEETRVVVLDGNRLEDYDTETSTKKQLKGNIYLAKVVRVEPSLQAAFVEYGGNRHGFLAFGEIHPDYYQIPVADRQRLIEMQEQEARDEEEAEDRAATGRLPLPPRTDIDDVPAEVVEPDAEHGAEAAPISEADAGPESETDAPAGFEAHATPARATQAMAIEQTVLAGPVEPVGASEGFEAAAPDLAVDAASAAPADELAIPPIPDHAHAPSVEADEPAPDPVTAGESPDAVTAAESSGAVTTAESHDATEVPSVPEAGDLGSDLAPEAGEPANEDHQPAVAAAANDAEPAEPSDAEEDGIETVASDAPPPETLGGENDTEEPRERRPSRFMRNYKIQEVIRRRQILLIQVVKEERGTKGAALTTYISLAGRYSVLMPNSPRGGGISRKITSAADRKRLKEATAELDLPRGMGLIVRTAGANRPKPEIKRDCEYLLRLWDDIRERTMQSVAPSLIYEEASLIKRAIRDVYSRDVDDILVDGEEGWRAAHEFMRMLMPTHARKVQLWQQPQPLFASHQVEAQLDAMLNPTVQLKSGGYLVINQTEALVAIDVNSGRSTRERGIEETALRTNLEAADEAARQLRLRDLAGLIVIDFIDMEAKKHNAMVERRMKEALKNDRARIQVGHISHFGLMELSRQRLRPSLAETSFVPCAHCGGTGHMRSTEGAAMHVLRAIEEEGSKRRAAEIQVQVASGIAMYILNHKRVWLAEIEARHAMQVTFAADDKLIPPEIVINRLRAQEAPPPLPIPIAQHPAPTSYTQISAPAPIGDDDDDLPDESDDDLAPPSVAARAPGSVPVAAPPATSGETAEEGERKRKRRRRRRRGGRREDGTYNTEAGNNDGGAGEAGVSEAGDESFAEGDDEDDDAPEIASVAPAPSEVSEAGPSSDEPAFPSEGTDEPRRRSRRGRRRRPDDIAAPAAPEPAPYAPAYPSYVGPTPADPFGGQAYDIFEVIEQQLALAEQAATIVPAATSAPVLAAVPEAEPITPDPAPPSDAIPAIASPAEAPPEPMPAESTTAPEPMPEPTNESAPEQIPVQAPEPAPEPSPVIQPVLVGSGEIVGEKKRGWWKR